MKKAILAVYVPEEYSEQLDRLSVDYSLFYHDENGTVKQVDVESRCPLRPLPKRIPTNEYGHMVPYGTVWNACLDAVEGE